MRTWFQCAVVRGLCDILRWSCVFVAVGDRWVESPPQRRRRRCSLARCRKRAVLLQELEVLAKNTWWAIGVFFEGTKEHGQLFQGDIPICDLFRSYIFTTNPILDSRTTLEGCNYRDRCHNSVAVYSFDLASQLFSPKYTCFGQYNSVPN